MDLFEKKEIKPMLIKDMVEAFNNPDYIFELKLDGERCVAYLDPANGTELRNKRNAKMLQKVPELSGLHKQVKSRCILDGELVVMVDGKPDFFEIQRRSLTNNSFKIQLQSSKHPASFIAYDILYFEDHEVTLLPLLERKKILESVVTTENDLFAVSRYIDNNGIDLYDLTVQNDLEGIVAKRKDSKYFFGKETKDWVKIKYLKDDDFVICGYLPKESNTVSVILGQHLDRNLIYKGHVTLHTSSDDYKIMLKTQRADHSPLQQIPEGDEDAIWLAPVLVCKVEFMMKTASGSMRQSVFRGIRYDKEPQDCVVLSLL